MRVLKRSGTHEPVSFDKISHRIQRLSYGLDHVEPLLVTQKVIQGVHDGVSTSELDVLASETAAYMSTIHPQYDTLAARIATSNLHKETRDDFLDIYPLMNEKTRAVFQENAETIDKFIVFERDFTYSYFGFKTMTQSYLGKVDGKIVERPQHMLMRISIGMWGNNILEAFKTYNYMSEKVFTHASPTMFNCGTKNPQCSSCFLLTMADDSIDGIYETLSNCAKISKSSGGIGFSVHNVRAAGSPIRGSNGISTGIPMMLGPYNATARYVNQGGRRKGAFAVYWEPWHADTPEILELKKNTGSEALRARDLFYALWIPDLFMRRVEANGTWSLMCPDESPGLCEVYGSAFDTLYEEYEKTGKFKKQIKAQDLWFAIIESQIESGTPYMMYKDACNEKSNQKNLGTIKSSNLCTEIVQYSSREEVAVCNLASLSLPSFVRNLADEGSAGSADSSKSENSADSADSAKSAGKIFDFDSLSQATAQLVRNLNQVIDINKYPIPEAKLSNLKHRPIGIGVQGLADVFFLLKYPFESKEAALLNQQIFETIYYAACEESNRLATLDGPYESFHGSPASKGILQFDMWNQVPLNPAKFDLLKESIMKFGLRNSLLVSPMPTASTAQILGNTECFEPISSNIFARNTIAGSFTMINQYLVDDLMELGLWNESMKNEIIIRNGSIQTIPNIPKNVKNLYKTVYEISQRVIIDMAADRGIYIDQSQSMNIHMTDPTFARVSSMHFHGWKRGLKTGMYYLRGTSAADAIKFTVNAVCNRDDKGCVSCSS